MDLSRIVGLPWMQKHIHAHLERMQEEDSLRAQGATDAHFQLANDYIMSSPALTHDDFYRIVARMIEIDERATWDERVARSIAKNGYMETSRALAALRIMGMDDAASQHARRVFGIPEE